MFLDHLPLDKLHNRKTAFGRLKLKVLYNPSEHWPDMSLLIVLVRMIDKMIDQRRIVYNNISKWLKGKDLRHFSLACSYSEDIISDAKRMVKFIKAHRSMKEAHVRVERKIFKQVILREKEITNLRNALQHLDKEISSGKFKLDKTMGSF